MLKIARLETRDRHWSEMGKSKQRVYVFPVGETVLENFASGRYERPYRAYRQLLPEIFERAGVPADTKASWSQKAGCSCGCSPGFIIDQYADFDIFVDVEEVEKTITGESSGSPQLR